MPATTPPPPEKIIDLFLKLRAKAQNEGATEAERTSFERKLGKMLEEHEGLKSAIDQIDRAARQKAARADLGLDLPPEPPADASWIERTLYRVANWGLDYVFSDLDPEDLPRKPETPTERRKRNEVGGLPGLIDKQVTASVEIYFDEEADDPKYEEVIGLAIDIPVRVWEKMRKAKGGARILVDYLDGFIEEAQGGDDDDDE